MGNDEKEQIRAPECEIFGVPKRYVSSTKDWLTQTPPGLATTYLNMGWSFFPVSKTEKTPLSKSLPMGRWKPYQSLQTTKNCPRGRSQAGQGAQYPSESDIRWNGLLWPQENRRRPAHTQERWD